MSGVLGETGVVDYKGKELINGLSSSFESCRHFWPRIAAYIEAAHMPIRSLPSAGVCDGQWMDIQLEN
jgi:hypothetical protein